MSIVSEYDTAMTPEPAYRRITLARADAWDKAELAIVVDFLQRRGYIVIEPEQADYARYVENTCPQCGRKIGEAAAK